MFELICKTETTKTVEKDVTFLNVVSIKLKGVCSDQHTVMAWWQKHTDGMINVLPQRRGMKEKV